MEEIVLGKYVPRETLIHKLDARFKIFAMIFFMVLTFLNYGSYLNSFIINGLLLLLCLIVAIISKIKISQIFSSLKIIWITILILLIMNILIPNSSYSFVLYDNGEGFVIYLDAIFQSIKVILRIINMILLTMILTSTTKSTDISFAFEWYLSPLKLFKVPVGVLAMIISLTLRFIPSVLEETNRLKNAQESRGVDFEHGNIFKKIKAYISLLIPLFVSMFIKSMELSDALEARGYNPNEKRTRYDISKFHLKDLFGLFIVLVISAGMIYLSISKFDILSNLFNLSGELITLGVK